MIELSRIFIFGVILGIGAAGGAVYSFQVVDLHREASQVTVKANGGKVETFRINLPRDRIMVGMAGSANSLPAELEWPGRSMIGDLQAEMFKVRDQNNAVIGIASRLASRAEATGPFIEWMLHLPARGTVYVKMNISPGADGYRNGRLIAGTREFEKLSGSVREQFIAADGQGRFDGSGRIELETAFVAPLGAEPLASAGGGNQL